MTKLKHLFLVFAVLTVTAEAQLPYTVHYVAADAGILSERPDSLFASQAAAMAFVANLPVVLQSKGFVTASVDTSVFDSASAIVHLYLGRQYKWARILTEEKDAAILEAVRWNNRLINGAMMDFTLLRALQQRILEHMEETGHPFAKIFLDSFQLASDAVTATLKIMPGPLYRIDSIRVYGNAKIDNGFLQRYLDIKNESIYNRKKLELVTRRIAELPYVQEERISNLSLLGTGSVLNLYLKQKKSSQVNVLVGFLPNSDAASSKKFLLTGDANILLRNALGAGETIGLNWQQLQVSSPRLNLLYQHPFIFRSDVGLNFTFDMFRKDTTFLNISMKGGAAYVIDQNRTATLFLQRTQTIVNGINQAFVVQAKRLPQDADVSATNLGVTYEHYTTDYRFNPRKGTEVSITTSAGTKNLKKNNQVLELKDPGNPDFNFERLYDTVKMKTYQFRMAGGAARYFPLGKSSTIKTGLQAGIFSSGNIFRNELFQIGGYRMLRGFDEESQYVSQYAVATLEYRYLIGMNSNFFAFADGAWARHALEGNASHGYIGSGLGMSFETRAGIFNIVWAIGKRNDTELNLRQSKIHLGFVNYF